MDHEQEVSRAQMCETRAALSEKIETLEQKVVDTVHGAANAVSQTVENVKDAVNQTVADVKDNFDVSLQVDRHPWAMLGGSLALGYLGGYLLLRQDAAQSTANGHSQPAPAGSPKLSEPLNGNGKDACTVDEAAAKPTREPAPVASKPGSPSGVNNQLEAEIANLKRLAIGTLLSLVRDLVTESSPKPMQPALTGVIDSITIQLGGDPIQGPVLKAAETVT